MSSQLPIDPYARPASGTEVAMYIFAAQIGALMISAVLISLGVMSLDSVGFGVGAIFVLVALVAYPVSATQFSAKLCQKRLSSARLKTMKRTVALTSCLSLYCGSLVLLILGGLGVMILGLLVALAATSVIPAAIAVSGQTNGDLAPSSLTLPQDAVRPTAPVDTPGTSTPSAPADLSRLLPWIGVVATVIIVVLMLRPF